MFEEKIRPSFEESPHEHFKYMLIAGFKYYEGAFLFIDLIVETVITIKAVLRNQYDDKGHDVFGAVAKKISPVENPERQVCVGVFIVKVETQNEL